MLQGTRSSAPSGGLAATEATATVSEEGTVAVTGITLPGQPVELPAECADAADQTARVVCAAGVFLELLKGAEQTATGPYQEPVAHLSFTLPAGADARSFTLAYDAIIHQVVTHTALVSVRQDWAGGVIAENPPRSAASA